MISIVMAYYNRKKLLLNTIESIQNNTTTDFEIIIVDDSSMENERLEDVTFKDNISLIRLEPENKFWVSSCIPYNIGFKKAKGDIIIIQNPECEHNGDIVKYSNDNCNDNNYLAFGCYSLPSTFDKTIYNRSVACEGDAGWYNHSQHRPVGYHFCSAITKKNLDELGGFDERYACGIDYDDNEFLTRVKRKQLNVNIVDHPFVFHQWHYTSNFRPSNLSNRDLYKTTLSETIIKVN